MSSLERSLARYDWYLPLSRVSFWAPIFFLYLAARFPIEQIFLLHAIYYAVVVVLEVPSGYFSDRIGRRATLLISSAAMVLAYTLFLAGGAEFWLFVCAQGSLALGYAFASGTDTSFHYDTLEGLGRGDEFATQQARLNTLGYRLASGAALLGGAVAVFALEWAYALALLNAVALLALVLAMREPPRTETGWATHGLWGQVGACIGYLRQPLLRWVFAYMVLQVVIAHVPYEFAQPYVAVVLGEPVSDARYAPLLTGVVSAGIAFVASFAAAYSIRLRDRIGIGGALLAVTGLQTALIATMAFVLHALVVPLLFLRSCQAAVGQIIVNATVTPRVPQALRATYLSVHSLAGRLGYSLLLLTLSSVSAGRSVDELETLQLLLRTCTGVALLGTVALWATRGAMRHQE